MYRFFWDSLSMSHHPKEHNLLETCFSLWTSSFKILSTVYYFKKSLHGYKQDGISFKTKFAQGFQADNYVG